jgi:uridylate kinase
MKYNRIVLKLSGEALAAKDGILDQKKLASVASIVRRIHDAGVQLGIVVGAGNIWRGRLAVQIGIEQSTGDYMGMLGTIVNALAIQSAIQQTGVECKVMSSINVNQVCEPYIRLKAIHHLNKGEVVIFAGGTGNPYFTTDTTATLRALEVGAQAIFMAKNKIDGVYDSDPRKNPDAKLLPELSFREVIERKLGVMDLTAVAMLEGKGIVIHVFNFDHEESFFQVLDGQSVGTIIK